MEGRLDLGYLLTGGESMQRLLVRNVRSIAKSYEQVCVIVRSCRSLFDGQAGYIFHRFITVGSRLRDFFPHCYRYLEVVIARNRRSLDLTVWFQPSITTSSLRQTVDSRQGECR